MSASQYKKKTKIEQNATTSCHVLHYHILQLVRHFHVRQFQHPPPPAHAHVPLSPSSRIRTTGSALVPNLG